MVTKMGNGKSFVRSFSTSLAPMRGLTSGRFIGILSEFGEPDEYISEFLRVHTTSGITSEISELLNNWGSPKPLSIQLLGRDCDQFVRVAKILYKCGAQGINLNFGCPMPKISRKGVGGSLLKELDLMDEIISTLIKNIELPISIKTRLGYFFVDEFSEILNHISRHNLQALYLHARTVRGLYSEPVNFEYIKFAKKNLSCPIIANGDIRSAIEAVAIANSTGADGVMIGRSAITNPWIFRQIRELQLGQEMFVPTGDDYIFYIEKLRKISETSVESGIRAASALKKYLVMISDFVNPNNQFDCQCLNHDCQFSNAIRRAETTDHIMRLCCEFFKNQYSFLRSGNP